MYVILTESLINMIFFGSLATDRASLGVTTNKSVWIYSIFLLINITSLFLANELKLMLVLTELLLLFNLSAALFV